MLWREKELRRQRVNQRMRSLRILLTTRDLKGGTKIERDSTGRVVLSRENLQFGAHALLRRGVERLVSTHPIDSETECDASRS